eukprot:3751204-Pleurochrysis_carterae.AAC.1
MSRVRLHAQCTAVKFYLASIQTSTTSRPSNGMLKHVMNCLCVLVLRITLLAHHLDACYNS